MRINIESIATELITVGFSKKKVREYHIPSIFSELWPEIELVPYCDKSVTKGILIFQNPSDIFAAAYELKPLKPNTDGSSRPILCDFCYTFRARRETALITFTLNREKTRTIAYYCCADLQCSLHVRGLTNASLLSKTQLREDISPEARISRFIEKTTKIFSTNNSTPIS